MSSSDCFSLPTIGFISVVMFADIMCIEGALARSRTPYLPPCFTIFGSSSFSSSIVGMTIP